MKDEPGKAEDQLDFLVVVLSAKSIQLHEGFFRGARRTFSLKKVSEGDVQDIRDALERFHQALGIGRQQPYTWDEGWTILMGEIWLSTVPQN